MKKLILMFLASVAVIFGVVATDQTLNPLHAWDCGNNAVVKCGVKSASDMKDAYNKDRTKGTKNIFNGMGISSSMIKNSTIKKGTVYKDGRVVVDGKVVATGASSAGRTIMSHTKKRVKRTYNGTVYYESPTSDSFRSSSLAAFVFFDKYGIFQAAVILDCGNPVKAKPVKPEPSYSCDALTVTTVEANKTYKFKVKYTVKNATLKSTTYVVKDASGKEISSSSSDTYTQTTPGTYSVEAHLVMTAYGKDYKVSVGGCKAKFTVAEKPKVPKVSITKKVDSVDYKKVEVGKNFTYQIKVTNTGEVDLKDVLVTDKAPTGVTLLQASQGAISGNNWSYTIPELKIGESVEFTITAKVAEYVDGKLVNTACVDAPAVPGKPDGCDDATVEVEKLEPEEMTVCRLEDKKYPVTIKKDEFNPELHSTDPADCVTEEEPPVTPPTPPVVTPPAPAPEVDELPRTGIVDGIMGLLGAGSVTTASVAYGVSRRRI